MGDEQRGVPESASGAEPREGEIPDHSHGMPLDEPQPSAPRRPELESEDGGPAEAAAPRGEAPRSLTPNRSYLEALLQGVPLPATREDLVEHAHRDGSPAAARVLQGLPSGRFSSLNEVGESLQPVQPAWPRAHRVPGPESDLPPGGAGYGVTRV